MAPCGRRGAGAPSRPLSVGTRAAQRGSLRSRRPGPRGGGAGAGEGRRGRPLPGLRESQAPPRLRCPEPRGLVLRAWRLQGGSSPLDGAKEVGEESRGSLPGCWAGCLPARPGPGPSSASREAVNNAEPASRSASGDGAPRGAPLPLAAQPAARQPPPLPQLLPPGASSPGAAPAGGAPTAEEASARRPAPAPGTLALPQQPPVPGRAGDGARGLCRPRPLQALPGPGVGRRVPRRPGPPLGAAARPPAATPEAAGGARVMAP